MMLTVGTGRAADDAKYPTNWNGEWTRVVHREVEVQGAFVQTKPWGLGQEAPLTPEYQQVHRNSMEDQKSGGLGNYPTARCLPSGMPRMMTFSNHEYVITPETTYLLLTSSDHLRRIFTDGRDLRRSQLAGYSIGNGLMRRRWQIFDVLEMNRYFKGPRVRCERPAARFRQSIDLQRTLLHRQKDPNIIHVLHHRLTR
jgi:hypothetical protein